MQYQIKFLIQSCFFYSFKVLHLLSPLRVSVNALTLFSMLSILWGSSFKKRTASTSTLNTDRIFICSAGNSPEDMHQPIQQMTKTDVDLQAGENINPIYLWVRPKLLPLVVD